MPSRDQPEKAGFRGSVVTKVTTPNTPAPGSKVGDGQKGFQGKPPSTPPKTGKTGK